MLVYRYLPEENPERLTIEGVPLRDLEVVDLAHQPGHVLEAIDLAPFYAVVKPAVSGDAADLATDVPAAVVEAAGRQFRRRQAVETKAAAADVAAPTESQEE